MWILLDGLDQNGNAYWYIAGVFPTLFNMIIIYVPDIVLGDGCSDMWGCMSALAFKETPMVLLCPTGIFVGDVVASHFYS